MEITRYTHSYRFLAYLAVVCSMAALARVSSDWSLFAVSVAGLTAGHVYMWRTRYAVSRLRTAILSLTLTALLVSLGRDILFSWTDDPVLLARYMVYGQIVTGFDLVTRRNVMGTLVLAGIVFMVLGQMAFDLWYPFLMGIFFLLALAATVAGHIDEESSQAEEVIGGTWRAAGSVWAGFVSALILLTAAVFLLMPRVGFGPLAQPSWLPSRIDLSGRGPTDLPSRPSASVSSEFLASRRIGDASSGDYIQLGYTGTAADAPVMHVRSRIVTYWRGAALDRYDGLGWLPSPESQTLFEVAPGEYVFPDSDRAAPGRNRYAQTYYLLTDQPNALFTGYTPGRVYLSPTALASLESGTTYRSVSRIPRLNPQRLRRDSVDLRNPEHLILPPITDRAAALAESIVEGAGTDYDRAARLEEFFLRNYGYDLGVELPEDHDVVDSFLFHEQSGYCAQFATAMAVMARHVGLPARVGVGYLPGVFNPMTGAFTVRAGDAHAWVEVRFRESVLGRLRPHPQTRRIPWLGRQSGAGRLRPPGLRRGGLHRRVLVADRRRVASQSHGPRLDRERDHRRRTPLGQSGRPANRHAPVQHRAGERRLHRTSGYGETRGRGGLRRDGWVSWQEGPARPAGLPNPPRIRRTRRASPSQGLRRGELADRGCRCRRVRLHAHRPFAGRRGCR